MAPGTGNTCCRLLRGEDEILPWLDEDFDEPPDAAAHGEKALEKAGLP